jgi:hypothetical protein
MNKSLSQDFRKSWEILASHCGEHEDDSLLFFAPFGLAEVCENIWRNKPENSLLRESVVFEKVA